MTFPKMETIYALLKEGENKVFIVEGKNDSKALRRLGFTNILEISGKPTMKLIEEIQSIVGMHVVILTDFDSEGMEKHSEISYLLHKHHIKTDPSFRHRIKTLFKIHKIEEINSFTKFMEDDYNGKISPIDHKILNRSRILSRWGSRETRRNRSNIWPD